MWVCVVAGKRCSAREFSCGRASMCVDVLPQLGPYKAWEVACNILAHQIVWLRKEKLFLDPMVAVIQ
jgi:hypothetical protein